MILNFPKDIKFSNYYKRLNLLSLCFIILSLMIHSIPLVLVDNKQDKQTIYYNIIVFSCLCLY